MCSIGRKYSIGLVHFICLQKYTLFRGRLKKMIQLLSFSKSCLCQITQRCIKLCQIIHCEANPSLSSTKTYIQTLIGSRLKIYWLQLFFTKLFKCILLDQTIYTCLGSEFSYSYVFSIPTVIILFHSNLLYRFSVTATHIVYTKVSYQYQNCGIQNYLKKKKD